ncbi:hypothetical protein SLS55_001312 [Diplodia seriata]|uniref:Rhodopsin domain-containing protein n=1 Tax=Diplodia seriata TaxID=420778 RepID=A0ABR3CWR1_9PEZI
MVSAGIYLTGVALAKISILIQYIRVFVGTKTIIASWATVAFIVTCCLVCFFGGIFACSPVEKFWNPTIPGTCINYLAIWYARTHTRRSLHLFRTFELTIIEHRYLHCSMAIATDLAIVVIPLPTIVNMNLENKKKWSLAFTFALGGFGCVTSIIRLYYLRFLTTTPDPTHYNPIPALWSAVELAVVIVCACLITLHPLLVRVLRPLRVFASQYHNSAPGATEEERARRRRERLPSYVQDGAGVSAEERRERYSRAVVAGWEGGKGARVGRGGGGVVVGLGTMLLESGWSEERLAPEGMNEGEIKVKTTVDVASSTMTTTTNTDADADAASVLTRERSGGEEGKWVDVEIGKGGV